jgi:hypothetical protein
VARIDYFNDPAAPKANSVAPSVTAIVPNEGGELLLVHQTDPQAAVGSDRSPPAPAAGREHRPGAPDHRSDNRRCTSSMRRAKVMGWPAVPWPCRRR